MNIDAIVGYFDGLCQPRNPGGTAAWGFAIYYPQGTKYTQYGVVGDGSSMSNNVAEYAGLCALFSYLDSQTSSDPADAPVLIRGDSQLVIRQMQGAWRAKGGLYYSYYQRAAQLKNQSQRQYTFQWVPREQNAEADALSNQAYAEWCHQHHRPVQFMPR